MYLLDDTRNKLHKDISPAVTNCYQYLLCRITLPLIRLTAFSKEVPSVFDICLRTYQTPTVLVRYNAGLICAPTTPKIEQHPLSSRFKSAVIQQHDLFPFHLVDEMTKNRHTTPDLRISHLSFSSHFFIRSFHR